MSYFNKFLGKIYEAKENEVNETTGIKKKSGMQMPIELDLDDDEDEEDEYNDEKLEKALDNAPEKDLVDLAGILGI